MIHAGHTRVVFCVSGLAFKFPKPTGSWSFVTGMLSNILEWQRWKASRHPQLARVYGCAPLGLCLIARRYRNTPYPLSPSEYQSLPFGGVDYKAANFALEGEQIILLDYGNNDFEARWTPEYRQWAGGETNGDSTAHRKRNPYSPLRSRIR